MRSGRVRRPLVTSPTQSELSVCGIRYRYEDSRGWATGGQWYSGLNTRSTAHEQPTKVEADLGPRRHQTRQVTDVLAPESQLTKRPARSARILCRWHFA